MKPYTHIYQSTDLVRKAAELSRVEMISSVPAFLTKVSRYHPRIVCFVGIGIWDIVEAALKKLVAAQEAPTPRRGKQKRVLCLQPYRMLHSSGASEKIN